MKKASTPLPQRYLMALRQHLKGGRRASRAPAQRLGREAAVLGIGPLELARVHEGALLRLAVSNRSDGPFKRAELFFNDALAAGGETQHAARPSRADLNRLTATLGRRSAELEVARRQLRRGAKAVAFVHGGNHTDHRLKESLQLQSRLRLLTHRALATQEKERYLISHELQDEIVQTLLGINVRLLSLKQQAGNNSAGLKKAIASAQRIVVNSTRFVRRFARRLDTPHPTPGDRSFPVV